MRLVPVANVAMHWRGIALALLLTAGCAAAEAPQFSWQRGYTGLVDGKPDIAWQPEPFTYTAGKDVRYIDYQGGNDNNPGDRKDSPWQHHPWDPAATGKAAQGRGILTYVFKQGVVYRGQLIGKESGRAGDPIRLTRDPAWGVGEAVLNGGEPLAGTWRRAGAEDAGLPPASRDRVWYLDLGKGHQVVNALWEVRDGELLRIPIAREPNWTVTEPNDPRHGWYDWASDATPEKDPPTKPGQNMPVKAVYDSDPAHLTNPDPKAYVGATIWAEWEYVMSAPYASRVTKYDPASHRIWFSPLQAWNPRWWPLSHEYYFLENLPAFLDSPGEYYYAADGPHAGRLYLRLPEDRDPNASTVEIARQTSILELRDVHDVAVTGLSFRETTVKDWLGDSDESYEHGALRLLGTCTRVQVANCVFTHVAQAILTFPLRDGDQMDHVLISDNDVSNADTGGIRIGDGDEWEGQLPTAINSHVSVLRNRLANIGGRQLGLSEAHAIFIRGGRLIEVAGNVIDRCSASGIHVYNGTLSTGYSSDYRKAHTEAPLARILVHDNKVTNSMLMSRDWGGIESWHTGPSYVYDNISGNAVGYSNNGFAWDHGEHGSGNIGSAFYFDHQDKGYLFNNIAWGGENRWNQPFANSTAILSPAGTLNMFCNNTLFRFQQPICIGWGGVERSAYLGNLVEDCTDKYVLCGGNDTDAPVDYPTLAFARNVWQGKPRAFGNLTGGKAENASATLKDFQQKLADHKARADQTGWMAERSSMRDAAAHDFRLASDAPAIGKGVKFFAPWGLYQVVGEWHFTVYPSDPTRIINESCFMADPHIAAMRGHQLDLIGSHISAKDFTAGTLENWTDGALTLDGQSQYCSMQADLPALKGRTVNMDTNNFLIEAVLKTAPGHAGGVIAAKGATAGYALSINGKGRPELTLRWGTNGACSRAAASEVNDGQWHHVIAEVDRAARRMTLYVDGRHADGELAGAMPDPAVSLGSPDDFLVGKSTDGAGYFAGVLDFLRVARSTLADADTTIEELYAWEFNGPMLKDFLGRPPAPAGRDAGALNYVEEH